MIKKKKINHQKNVYSYHVRLQETICIMLCQGMLQLGDPIRLIKSPVVTF